VDPISTFSILAIISGFVAALSGNKKLTCWMLLLLVGLAGYTPSPEFQTWTAFQTAFSPETRSATLTAATYGILTILLAEICLEATKRTGPLYNSIQTLYEFYNSLKSEVLGILKYRNASPQEKLLGISESAHLDHILAEESAQITYDQKTGRFLLFSSPTKSYKNFSHKNLNSPALTIAPGEADCLIPLNPKFAHLFFQQPNIQPCSAPHTDEETETLQPLPNFC
jgi:hypothetical protein